MKHIFYAALFVVIVLQVNAQAPASFNYQGIVRNNAGAPLASQAIAIQASILQDTATSAVIYTEVQHVTTSSTGYFTIQIGKGAATAGSFAQINWGDGRNKWLQISVDANAGTDYKLIGSSQLVSVPYALYAGRSGPAGNYGDIQYWDGNKWQVLPAGTVGQVLTMMPARDIGADGTGGGALPMWVGAAYPVVTTIAPSSITNTSAIVGVHVIRKGGSLQTSLRTVMGICLSKDSIPLMPNNGIHPRYAAGSSFEDTSKVPTDTLYTISGLEPSTTYYVRAYAAPLYGYPVDAVATVLGNQFSLTTGPAVVPTLTAPKIIAVTKENVLCGGTIIDNGGVAITSKGFVIGISPDPDTLNASKFAYGSGDTGYFRNNLTGLASNTKYYVRAYAVNSAGIGYGPTVSFTTSNNPYSIGQSYGGGIIYYVDPSGQHGLIAAIRDLNLAPWSLTNNQDGKSDTARAIGAGAANTAYIINLQGPGQYAASICASYRGGGFADWFLPSLDELRTLVKNNLVVDGFNGIETTGYWSSSQGTWYGSGLYVYKTGFWNDYVSATHGVRPVRSF